MMVISDIASIVRAIKLSEIHQKNDGDRDRLYFDIVDGLANCQLVVIRVFPRAKTPVWNTLDSR